MTRLLVVDDEERICSLLVRTMRRQGFEIDAAETAAAALELIDARDYDLIILDLLLPDLNGYQLLRKIVDDHPSARVLVLSAIGDVESRVHCLRLGAVDYLSKPFAIAELVERVRRRVEEHQVGSASRWLEVGALRLDLRRRVLHVNERVVLLSPREFVLLEYLMRRANEVCTRSELLVDVWGYSFDPGSNVVDVCIGRLRSKLEPDLIETVRNVGYCLSAS